MNKIDNNLRGNLVFNSKTNRNVLIYLSKKDFSYASNVLRGIDSNSSEIIKSFKILKEEGLIERIENNNVKRSSFVCKDKKKKHFKLTDKGKIIANLLLQINKELKV